MLIGRSGVAWQQCTWNEGKSNHTDTEVLWPIGASKYEMQ